MFYLDHPDRATNLSSSYEACQIKSIQKIRKISTNADNLESKPASPQKRGRGRPPKDPFAKRTRKQAKAEELDQIGKCRVFFPTEDEFLDFMGYVIKCES